MNENQIYRIILIIRLSSIGDIVLTTPIVRALKTRFPDSEIHYITRPEYLPLLQNHPDIHTLHSFEGKIRETIQKLRQHRFQLVIDLHRSILSRRIKGGLGALSFTFPKLNVRKYLLTRFKINTLPDLHIVDRYAMAIEPTGAKLDENGLDFFISAQVEEEGLREVWDQLGPDAVAVVLGAKHATKKYPSEYYPALLNGLSKPVLLIGGKPEMEEAERISSALNVPVMNIAGKSGLLESAARMKACKVAITNDTGFMHIAAAFGMKVFSIWGNTVPAFGMTPYRTPSVIIETTGLPCRPCSKLGHESCPKKHFRCMMDLKPETVLEKIKEG